MAAGVDPLGVGGARVCGAMGERSVLLAGRLLGWRRAVDRRAHVSAMSGHRAAPAECLVGGRRLLCSGPSASGVARRGCETTAQLNVATGAARHVLAVLMM